ncbi:MAG TPA: hypothetical protein P5552_10715 [Candidatus Competibacteraceae bacterium]|nr:hypothetical protein [Candidatus Competibacteraceae bacterium]
MKRNQRFTMVVGNPPYSNFGQTNKNPFILRLLDDYKRGLDEKKINLDDDFIKFVRFSQHLIDQSWVGVIGMITSSTYLDGLTHRRMRASLCESFNRVGVLNLHGSSKRQEKNPSGGIEENIFDIQAGVAVSLFSKKETCFAVEYADLWGARDEKYRQLDNSSSQRMAWAQLTPVSPYWFFRPKELASSVEYQTWLALKDLFRAGGCGIKTERDRVSIHWTKEDCREAVEDFRTQSESTLRTKYDLHTDSRDWKVANAKADVRANRNESLFCRILYRPFDIRHTWYSGQTRGFIGTPGCPTMRHMLNRRNIALLTCRQQAELGFHHAFCTTLLAECCTVSLKTREITSVFPLYLLSDDETQHSFDSRPEYEPSFSHSLLKGLSTALGLPQQGVHGMPASVMPEDIFNYVYAVLHSPTYRTRYSEFLKIDFPRLPLTSSLDLFRALSQLGGELVALHLMESPKLDQHLTTYTGPAAPVVEKVSWANNTVWLDKAQKSGFRGVPENVWNFHIGGYQVCNKWLKDRKGRTLTADDINHYHRIVVALSETIRLMAEIDEVIDRHGGWPGAFVTESNMPEKI